eukprot:1751997-Rhodomonas_salina.1
MGRPCAHGMMDRVGGSDLAAGGAVGVGGDERDEAAVLQRLHPAVDRLRQLSSARAHQRVAGEQAKFVWKALVEKLDDRQALAQLDRLALERVEEFQDGDL